MPVGVTLNISSNRGQYQRAFEKYASWYTDAHPEANLSALFEDQSRKLAVELYNQTAEIAPSVEKLEADIKRQGWRIPAWFRGSRSRIGRGVPAMWLGTAFDRQPKPFKGRGAKAKNEAAREAWMAQKPTLAQMEAFVLKMRSAARLYLASGWLGAVVRLGGSVKSTSGQVDPARGGAEITRGQGISKVTIWNRTDGIVTMDLKKQFVEKALTVRAADMLVYVRRKMDEAAMKYLRAA